MCIFTGGMEVKLNKVICFAIDQQLIAGDLSRLGKVDLHGMAVICALCHLEGK